MTVPCTSCGENLTADDVRCPTCGTLAPPRPGASVFAVDAADEPLDEPTMVADGTGAVPWAIPIRQPASVGVAGPDRDSPTRALLSVLLAVVLLAGAALIVGQLLTDGGDEVAEAPPLTEGRPLTDREPETEVADEAALAERRTDAAEADTSTTAAETTTTTESTTTTTASTTTTTTAAPAASSGSAPQLSSSFREGWVAQLVSVPTSAGAAQVEEAWRAARSYAAGAVVTRSGEWPSMQPGFWVVVDPGPFTSADDVRAFCASVGHADRDDCLPRQLDDRR